MYYSTKQFGPITTSHRQWRDEGPCSAVHGYSRYVEMTFKARELDEKGWVMDFGDLKWMKEKIEENWDHRTLIADDDPLLYKLYEMDSLGLIDMNVMITRLGHGPGIEQSCKFLYDILNSEVQNRTLFRVTIDQVRIWEHAGNSAIYRPND